MSRFTDGLNLDHRLGSLHEDDAARRFDNSLLPVTATPVTVAAVSAAVVAYLGEEAAEK